MDENSWREWWRFAVEEHGIGTCTASMNRAPSGQPDMLAFRQGEQVTVLYQVAHPGHADYPGGLYLGCCAYSIGLFHGSDMRVMPPLYSVGLVDAQIPLKERAKAPTTPVQSIHLPPGYVLTRTKPFEEAPSEAPAPSTSSQTLPQTVRTPPVMSMDPEEDEKMWGDSRDGEDPTYAIYDAYFQPVGYNDMPSNKGDRPATNHSHEALLQALDGLDTADVSGVADDSMVHPRPIDEAMNQMTGDGTNRLLRDSISIPETQMSSTTRSTSNASGYHGKYVQTPEFDRMYHRQSTPHRTGGRPISSDMGHVSSPLRRLHTPEKASTPIRSLPMMASSSSLPTPRSGTPQDGTLPTPAPSVHGSPIGKPTLDTSENALSERAQLFQQWTTLLTDRSKASRTHKKALQLVHVGVPHALRGRIWMLMAGKRMHPKEGVFQKMCQACEESLQDPTKYPFSMLIEQDLDQCFPKTQPFEGLNGSTRDDIRLILYAYAYYHPDIGYTEGMCLVVGILLTHLERENAFWLLDTFVREYGMDRVYAGHMQRLHIDNFVVDEILRLVRPALHHRLKDLHIEPILFMPGWILPLFVRTLPWTTLLRVWDMFLCYGHPFLIRVVVAIVCLSEESLMQLTDPNDRSAALRQLVFVNPAPLNEQQLLRQALELPITDKEILKMEISAEGLVNPAARPSTALDRNENVLRGQLQGKPVTKKTLRLLTGRKKRK